MKASSEKKSLKTQVGGNHYKKYKIEPIDFFHYNQIPPVEAGVCKYVIRHKDKNGVEDLLKARHLIEYLLETDYDYVEMDMDDISGGER